MHLIINAANFSVHQCEVKYCTKVQHTMLEYISINYTESTDEGTVKHITWYGGGVLICHQTQ